jgi:hypothetical protein
LRGRGESVRWGGCEPARLLVYSLILGSRTAYGAQALTRDDSPRDRWRLLSLCSRQYPSHKLAGTISFVLLLLLLLSLSSFVIIT